MTSVKEIQSVRNACRVIEAIARLQPIGVSDLAREIEIDKSAAHRLAVTLHAAGWLDRTKEGHWSIAPALIPTIRESATSSLAASARPLLQAARDETGELAMLVVPDGKRLMIIDGVNSPHDLRVSVRIGVEMAGRHSSALRILVAHLPEEELGPWRRIDPGLTDEALAEIRARGWARNDGEVDDGTSAVAAALLSPDGVPVGLLVVCGPSTRFVGERMRRGGELVAQLAASWTG